MEQQCHLVEVSRAGFYRYLKRSSPRQEDMVLRGRLQQLAVEHHRRRGYRLLTGYLRREGHLVNHKRVLSRFPNKPRPLHGCPMFADFRLLGLNTICSNAFRFGLSSQ